MLPNSNQELLPQKAWFVKFFVLLKGRLLCWDARHNFDLHITCTGTNLIVQASSLLAQQSLKHYSEKKFSK